MQGSEPQFYFALPRFIAHLRGRNSSRTENNWLEANLVGGTMHAIVFLFTARLLLSQLPVWQQVLLSVPVILLVLLAWVLFFLLSLQLIKLLRAAGLFRALPNFRLQSVLAGAGVTALAWQLALTGSSLRVLGLVWIAAVVLNLFAAAFLAATHADSSAAD
ncbi:hypothetical protein BH20VER1_BH20VER1_03840 [soil metagenome]